MTATPRKKVVLTIYGVEHAKPEAKRYELGDAGLPGLYLVVQPSGSKSYALRYRVAGQSRKWTIGSHPQITLAEARQRARDGIGKVARGDDPSAEKAALRRNVEASAAPQTIDALIALFLKKRPRSRRRKPAREVTWTAYASMITNDIIPRWTGRRLDAIKRGDVRRLLEEIAEDRPVRANRVYAVLSKLFRWGVNQEFIAASPIAGLDKPSAENERKRTLSDAELKLVLNAADQMPDTKRDIVHLLLLTVGRRSEVAGMAWREIDLAEQVWTLPDIRAKNGREHKLSLSSAAVEILTRRQKDSSSPFVFPHSLGGGSFSNFSLLKRELDAIMLEMNDGTAIEPWRLHDLRRSSASALQRLGVLLPVTECILNHVSGSFSGIVGLYQTERYANEAREALERLAMHYAKLQADNVIDMRRRAK